MTKKKEVKDCIFLYADKDSPVSEDVPSISMPYKGLAEFRKENPDLKQWAKFSKANLLEAWGVKKELEALQTENERLRKVSKKIYRTCYKAIQKNFDEVTEDDLELIRDETNKGLQSLDYRPPC